MKEKPKILMVGPHPETKSGIAYCIRGYLHSPLAEAFDITVVSSYEFANRRRKLVVAMKGLIQFARLLAGGQYPVVHIHTSGFTSFYRKTVFVMLARLFRKRILLHVHSSRFKQFYENAPSQALVRWVLHQADVLIVLSRSWKRYFGAIVRNRIEVVPTAIDTASPWLPETRSPKKEILFVGGYWRRKGVFDLIEAMTMVVAEIPDVELVLIGFPDERERKEAEALWKERGLDKTVKMLGWVDDAMKRDRLATAGVFVLPSYDEGMPMSIMEAMASGIPVVSTAVGGIPEEVEDGKTGHLISPGDRQALADRMISILASPESAAQMGEAGRIRARDRFDIAQVTRKVAVLYRER